MTLEGEGEEEEGGVVERTLNLGWGGESRRVDHVQFTLWPNYGVVENVTHLANFVRKVKEDQQRTDKCFFFLNKSKTSYL